MRAHFSYQTQEGLTFFANVSGCTPDAPSERQAYDMAVTTCEREAPGCRYRIRLEGCIELEPGARYGHVNPWTGLAEA